jgi:hypothetical protein
LAEEFEGGLGKIRSVLLEKRAGRSPWNCSGDVLEPWSQGAGQDHIPVLDGERVREVDKTLHFVANLSSLAGKGVRAVMA